MKTLIFDKEYKVNPKNKPFFTGFGGSLFEVFNKQSNEIVIKKQLLFVSSHYTTFSFIKNKNKTLWYFWNKKVKFYSGYKIEYYGKPEYINKESEVYKLMKYLEQNENTYYLCYFSYLRDKQFNYICKK